MSQTKQWVSDKGLTTRKNRSTGAGAGSGGNIRMFVGYYGGFDFRSYQHFHMDWTGVGQIVSAVLNVYTDDGLGVMPSTINENPVTIVRRLVASFSEGTNDTGFASGDYALPASTTSDSKTMDLARAENGLTQIDITAQVEAMAPTSVKRRNGTGGGNATNYGFTLIGSSDALRNWAGWSEDQADSTLRPFITLTYEYGLTSPNTPTNLAPAGAVSALDFFEGDFSDIDGRDRLAASEVEVYTSAATSAGQIVTGGTRIYSQRKAASNTETLLAHFTHTPDALHLQVLTNYKWRVRVTDNEGSVSPWTALTTFSVTNTDPNAPTTTPADGASYTTLDGVLFRGGFTDPDVGDTLLAYQVQMSAFPEGDARWDDDQYILWNTGKRYVSAGDTSWEVPYGGGSLTASTYYWRARVWDNHHGHSSYTYHSIAVTQDFEAEPGTTDIQLRPHAPWRIVIRDMFEADGVTRKAGRGPGNVVAILEDSKNTGASKLYNSPGEMHFTLGVDHPQVSVIEPKQTHYSVQFYSGDGWREKYAGLMWDVDATELDIVFYGIDYLSLLDYVLDERYDASNPDKPVELGGSKYVTAGHNSINYIVTDQLTRAIGLANSPVGFIGIGAIATMSETLTVYSTYVQVLSFITSMLDSHRAATGKKTRISVKQTTGGAYQFVVEDDPGVVRDDLRMRYGELVQGYRVVPFGQNWGSRLSAIGRAKDGLRVMYETKTAPGIDEAVWGRFTKATFIDGVADENDLLRRTAGGALRGGKLGSQIGLALRSGILQPFDGYDITDQFPIDIEHGAIDTTAFGSGYWTVLGVTWTADAKTGKQNTVLTFTPREDSTPPDTDLLTLKPISPQAEWQIGWQPPTQSSMLFIAMDTGLVMDGGHLLDEGHNSLTGRFFLDQTTGSVYELAADGTWSLISAPPTVTTPSQLIPSSRVTLNSAGVAVANLTVLVTP